MRVQQLTDAAILLVYVLFGSTGLASAVYHPFSHNHTFAYVFRKRVEPRWRERDRISRRNGSSAPGFISAVRDHGMAWNSLGVAFPEGWDFSSSLMRHVLEPHFLYTGIRDQPSLQQVVLTLDHRLDVMRRPLSRGDHVSSNPLLQGLSRDGFVLVDDWGIDMDALSAEVETAIESDHRVIRRGAAVVYNGELQYLAPLLKNATLLSAAHAYLGRRAELTGYEVLRLTDGLATESQYISGYWHHDRCGRRLKAFVFLHDVGREGGRPTEVARGSQDTLYYSYHDNWEARFDDAYVQRNYATEAMVGRRGGGFIFDTNAIHRGVVNGTQSRTVVILEFNEAKKSTELRTNGERSMPCPSGSMFKIKIKCAPEEDPSG